jgi:hypothetical protein
MVSWEFPASVSRADLPHPFDVVPQLVPSDILPTASGVRAMVDVPTRDVTAG